MSWFTRVASIAALTHGIALAIGYFAPVMSEGNPRAALIVGVISGLALINARGIRQSALFIDGITIAKLVPLAIFIAIGLFFVDWMRLTPLPALGASQVGAGALLLIYAYGGYEVMGVPAGETRNPRTDLAFGMVMTVVTCAVIYVLAQIITMTVLPDVTQSKTPIADSAAIFLGPAGALMVGIGSLLAITGNVTGSLLGASRYLFAFAENAAIPRYFTYIHPRFRTPTRANLVLGRGRARPRALGLVRAAARGECARTPGHIRRRVGGGAGSAAGEVSGSREACRLHRAVRSGDPVDRVRRVGRDRLRRDGCAARGRRSSARRRRGSVPDDALGAPPNGEKLRLTCRTSAPSFDV